MTSYQKLKLENERLKKKVDILLEDNSFDSSLMKKDYRMGKIMESIVWSGCVLKDSLSFDGLAKSAKNKL